MTQTWPSLYDSLPDAPGEPGGYHLRECLENGFPLMGSSPAERAEFNERLARIKRQALRDHPFEGDGPYCAAMLGPSVSGNAEHGFVAMHVGCGYPPDTHPVPTDVAPYPPEGGEPR